MSPFVSIVFPTLNGGSLLEQSLKRIAEQEYSGGWEILCIDSGSSDATREIGRRHGAEVLSIRREDFHHAKTRNLALDHISGDRVLFMVQDAIPASDYWLSALIRSLEEGQDVVAVYTDQVPHRDADLYGRFETESISRGRGDKPVLQALESREAFQRLPYFEAYRMIALDNVCALYRREALARMPFPMIEFAEDMAWAMNQLMNGKRIKYDPSIKVFHSHTRTPRYRFIRQIINSRTVAKIMGRVYQDIGFLSMMDLVSVTLEIRDFASEEGKRLAERLNKNVQAIRMDIFDEILRAIPHFQRMRWRLSELFSLSDRSRSGGCCKEITDGLRADMTGRLNHIFANDAIDPEKDLWHLMEQVSADLLGRLFGEAIASWRLSKKPGRIRKAWMDRDLGQV